MSDDLETPAGGSLPGPPPPPVEGAATVDATPVAPHPHDPRPGDLTVGWRTATVALWTCVVLAFAAVWNASVQLGLSTWWLGPRADPQSRLIQFSPFIAPVMMVLGAINHVRRIASFGIIASVIVIGVGIGDLDRVSRLAIVEIAVGVAALGFSVASLSGTYRSATPAASADSAIPGR